MNKWVIALIIFVGILGCCLVAYFIGNDKGYKRGYADGLDVPVQHDTIIKIDTLTIDKPVPYDRWHDKIVYVPVKDTIVHNDTTYIALEREKVKYKEEEFEAVVSGIDPLLDYIQVYPKTITVTNTITKQKKFSFGVSVGPGIVWWNKEIHGGIGAVVGIQYNF